MDIDNDQQNWVISSGAGRHLDPRRRVLISTTRAPTDLYAPLSSTSPGYGEAESIWKHILDLGDLYWLTIFLPAANNHRTLIRTCMLA